MQSKASTYYNSIKISISGVTNTFFIDKNDIYKIVKFNGADTSKKLVIAALNLKAIETQLEKEEWIKNAEVFFDNNNILNVAVAEKEPIARIFTTTGQSFYIDSFCNILPLSNKFSARLPLFTNYPYQTKIITSADSTLLQSIKNLGLKINNDAFLMALIEQVDIAPNNNFELVPKVGNQKIYFGTAIDVDKKFIKLKLFYKNVIAQVGWNRYATINLQYNNQVVARIRGAADVLTDSLQTLLIMKTLVEAAKLKSADTIQTFIADADKNKNDSTIILQSIEREEEGMQEVPKKVDNAITPLAIPKTTTLNVKQKPTVKAKKTTVEKLITPVKPPIKNPLQKL